MRTSTSLSPILVAFTIVISILGFEQRSFAQSEDFCGTDQAHKSLILEDESYRQAFGRSQARISKAVADYEAASSQYEIINDVLQIPVVVHVIHTGTSVGVGANISDAQIDSAIIVMNQRFRKTPGTHGDASGVDTKIQFVLASRDPDCNATNGIVRVNGSSVTNYASEGIEKSGGTSGADQIAVKNLSRWPNTDYMNIWVVSEIDNNNGGGGTLGYAYYPGATPAYDGIVVQHTAFGVNGTVLSSFDLNKTITHEAGHYLGLYHTFEGDIDNTQCPSVTNGCGSDLGDCCGDTDPHRRSPFNCPTGTNACTGNPYGLVVHNYMDYSNEACADMYSNDQMIRMRSTLWTTRRSLLNSHAYLAPDTFSITAAACTPQTTNLSNGFSMGIGTVILDSLNVTSSAAVFDSGYVDRTCNQVQFLDTNTSYNISIENPFTNAEDVRVYIDYNSDGDFLDSGEDVFTSDTDTLHTGSFTTPASPTTNKKLRMRVVSDWQGNTAALNASGSCYAPQYGQVEDYSVIFLDTTTTTPGPPAATASGLTGSTGPGGVGSDTTNIMWLKSTNDVNTSGGSVISWEDQSGNNRVVTQTTTTRQPSVSSNQVNSYPAVRFDGNNDILDGTMGSGNLNTVSVFTVGGYDQTNQGSNDHDYFYSIGSAWNTSLNHGRGASNFNGGSGANKYYAWVQGAIKMGNSTVLSSAYNIHSQRFDNASTFHHFRVGGSTQTVQDISSSISISKELRLGALKNGSITHPLDGGIAEFIVYDVFLNETQTTIIENYLAAKYALTISNDLYSYQGTHPHEVAGIGQESSTDNHPNARGTSMVRINNAGDLNDGEYLIWGHNNAGLSSSSNELPPAFSGTGLKLNREWVSDETGGDIGLVDITFDVNVVSLAADPLGYRLLTDPDGAFNDGNVVVNASPLVTGNFITFSGIDLSTNNYFTLAHNLDITECDSETSLDWEGNPITLWTCDITPDSTKEVTIKNGHSVTITGDVSCNSLTIESTGTLTIASTGSLTIKDDANIDGTLICQDGSRVAFRGTTGVAQIIDNNTGDTLSFYELVVANNDTVRFTTGDIGVRGGLFLNKGMIDNTTSFTLSGNSSSAGHVAHLEDNIVLGGSGDYSVDRHVSSRAAGWNVIGSSGVLTDLEDLDNEIYMSGFPGSDGFSQQGGGGSFVSIASFNNITDQYVVPSNTTDSMSIGKGFECYLGTSVNNWDAGKWNLVGDYFLDTISLSMSGTGGGSWNLVANPFPAYLDFNVINANHGPIAGNEYWYYDVDSSAYRSRGPNSIIPPGQGFWIDWNSTSGQLFFDPQTNMIVSNPTHRSLYKNEIDRPQFRVRVINDETSVGSAVYLRKDAMAYSGADELDATPLRLPQADVCNLSMEIDEQDLMVNYVSPADEYLEIPLRMDPGAKGNFTMDFSGFSKFREYQCINLVDNATGEQIPISSSSTYALNAESGDEPIYMTLILSQKDYENCIANDDVTSDPVRISSYEKNVFVDFNLDQRAQADVVIYNALGDRIHTQSVVAGYARQTIDLGFVNTGVYFVNIHINGETFSEKVVLK